MPKHISIAPVIPVELDRTRNLLFDFGAMEAIEDALPGVSTLSLEFWGAMTMKRARIAVWAGLMHEEPTLTMDQVKGLLAGKDPAPIIEAVMKAWGISRPEPKDGDEANPPIPETSSQLGSASGVSPDTISA